MPLGTSERVEQFVHPSALVEVADVRSAPPRRGGMYGWWFLPGSLSVPERDYSRVESYELLYVGIAPRKPTSDGRESASTLRPRLVKHATGDASRSTLRLTLGVLLADKLDLVLGSHANRLNFGPTGESHLTAWLNEHARVSWVEQPQPWLIEDEMLEHATLALNVDGRDHDPFARELKQRRMDARQAARRGR